VNAKLTFRLTALSLSLYVRFIYALSMLYLRSKKALFFQFFDYSADILSGENIGVFTWYVLWPFFIIPGNAVMMLPG